MSLSINPSGGGRAAHYGRRAAPQPPASATPQASPTARPPAEAAAKARAPEQPAAAQDAGGLSAPEREMIAQQFPETPALSMRLYGPGRSAQTVRPGAVGGRLDVQG